MEGEIGHQFEHTYCM